MAGSEMAAKGLSMLHTIGPKRADLDTCVHCGLCLNACPTYRELGLEMDSPRGRVYQMVRVHEGRAEVDESYQGHIELCLACRACETACPSGVPYGRLVEAARADIEARTTRPLLERWTRDFLFGKVLPSPFWLRLLTVPLYFYQQSGLEGFVNRSGLLNGFPRLKELASLSPRATLPSFFRHYGKTFPALGETRYRVAFLGGCMANVSFAPLHEATLRVLQRNGCEVVVPAEQTCCGALHVHAGRKADAQRLAIKNIDALLAGGYDAILTNTAGCGCALKEYGHLLEDDEAYSTRAKLFAKNVKDVNEFVASIEPVAPKVDYPANVTYQDSCHLTHGQKLPAPPRKLLGMVPGLTLKEMPFADHCCGSAGIYNVQHTEMAMALLEKKMDHANGTRAEIIASANPGCLLQLQAGVRLHGNGQRVLHVMEVLDEAYGDVEQVPAGKPHAKG
ncbi:MAG: heterodisulfide reductase-related iron-sulfur binding cluster [Bryobacterales bacterium]|nr:heterodisulfide reductase-related iron-sulfur binding cluster [Bryobacterales bacterium]